jgi:hypothetical protein
MIANTGRRRRMEAPCRVTGMGRVTSFRRALAHRNFAESAFCALQSFVVNG